MRMLVPVFFATFFALLVWFFVGGAVYEYTHSVVNAFKAWVISPGSALLVWLNVSHHSSDFDFAHVGRSVFASWICVSTVIWPVVILARRGRSRSET